MCKIAERPDFPLEARDGRGRTALDIAQACGAKWGYVAAALRGAIISRRDTHLRMVAKKEQDMVVQHRLWDDAYVATLHVHLWNMQSRVSTTQHALDRCLTNIGAIQSAIDNLPPGAAAGGGGGGGGGGGAVGAGAEV